MSTTKMDLVNAVRRNLDIPHKDCLELVNSVFDVLTETLANGNNVKLSGFGNFTLRDKRARRGRNPKTGEETEITARRVVTFKASQLVINIQR